MANTLKKSGITTYTAAVAPVPARPAYCVERQVTEDDSQRVGRGNGPSGTGVSVWSSAGYHTGVGVGVGASSDPINVYVPAGVSSLDAALGGDRSNLLSLAAGDAVLRYKTSTVCFPAVAAVPGVPASFQHSSRVGWNGGARSVAILTGDGFTKFTVPTSPKGVVAGFAAHNTGSRFDDVTHGVYVHGSTIDIVESGQVVTTASVSPSTNPDIVIKRESGYVDYQIGGWRYRSNTPSVGVVFLDAALYTTSDFVDDPELAALSSFDADYFGGADLVLPNLAMFSGEDPGASAMLVSPALVFSVTAVTSGLNQSHLVLPSLAMFAGAGVGSSATLSLSPLTLESTSGVPEPIVGGADLTLPPLVFSVAGYTGVVGGATWSLPPLSMLSSEGVYGEARLTLGALAVYADDGPAEGTYGIMQDVVLLDFAFTPPTLFASIIENLELQEAEATVVLAFLGTIFEGLMISESLTITQMLQAVVEERLVVNSSTRQGSLESIQYAVNVATGALTTYQGFNFHGFVKVGETTYAYKPDGLYKLRPGDDAGTGINAMVDFGVVPIMRDEETSPMNKTNLHDAFLGLGTDGCAYMKLTADDGCERTYRVIQRHDVDRSKFGKRITAREWRVKLELIDATNAVLDGIEYVAAVSTRRWTR